MSDPTPEERAEGLHLNFVKLELAAAIRAAENAASVRARNQVLAEIVKWLNAEAPKWQACSHAVSYVAQRILARMTKENGPARE